MNEDITRYLDGLPDKRRGKLLHIHDLITSNFPDVVQSTKYKMPTYELGDNWISMGNQKSYISVYTCSHEIIESYLKKHPEINAGKGCLRFRDTQDVDLHDLKTVIQKALTFKNIDSRGQTS